MKKTTIMLLLSLFYLAGCEEKQNPEAVELSSKKESVKPEASEVLVLEPKDLLGQLGLNITDGKIVIDINKTSNFFENIENQMQNKAKEIETKIANSELNMTENMGIEVQGEQIAIDLNKTKKMLQQINILMKDIFLDINSSNH